mgnify:FL=1
MQITPQTSLPSGGPDSLIASQGTLLLSGGDTNAGQLTVTLSAGSVTLTPYWWSQTSNAWIPASGGYSLTVDFAVAPAVSATFTRASEAQWWALLKTGGGTITSCDLEAVVTTESGGVTAVTGTGLVSVTAGATPVVSLVSGAANLVVATPNGGAGVPVERALVAADLPVVPVAKGGTGVATAPANYFLGGPTSGADAAPSFRALPASTGITNATLFFSPIDLGAIVGYTQIAGGYSWGTSWLALKSTTITNIRAYCADVSGTLYLKLWVAGVAVASGTVAVTAAGIYTLATPFSYVIPPNTTFTVSAYADAEVQGIPNFPNPYFSGYPALASPTLMLANPRLYSGAGNVEPTSVGSNYIIGVEPTVGA